MSSNTTDLVPEIVVGIDLGTTYSCVGICRNNKVEIISNEHSNRTTPSYVAFNEDTGQRLVGKPAKDQLIRNPQRTIYNIKRLMGRKWNDELVQQEIKNFSFKVVEKDSKPYVEIQTKKFVLEKSENSEDGLNEEKTRVFSAEDVSAMILAKIKKTAEDFLTKDVKHAVITVPSYFTDAQRQATKTAGELAGLKVLKILNEPTAAAMAYGINEMEDKRTIVVYDLGGGTFDVSVMTIENKIFTVLATCGNSHLGGEDFDQNVVNYFVKLYKTKNKEDISKNNRAIQKLRKEIETAKRTLTHESSTQIVIESFVNNNDFKEILTRAKFEELNKQLFKDTLIPLQQALDDAKLTKDQVDEIIMVGGSSRIPKIRELVKEFFGGKEPFQKINPDEAVAYGATVHAGMLSGQQNSIVLHDVNSLSLGIENSDGTISIIIPRNTIIPVIKTQLRTTSEDYQTTAKFAVYEGELPLAKDNVFLAEFELTNIENALKGIPRFATTFKIDDNGILHVSAQDEKTKEKIDIIINLDEQKLTDERIEKMLKISKEYDELDELLKESVNSRMEYANMVYSLQEHLDQNNLTETQKEKLQTIMDENLKWLEDNKISKIEEYWKRKKKLEEDIKPYISL